MDVVRGVLAIAAGAVAAPAPAAAAPWTVTAPGGDLTATADRDGGALNLTVRRNGRAVLRTPLAAGVRTVSAGRARRRERLTTPAGKRRAHRLDARVLRLVLGGGRRVDVLVAADGVAVRVQGIRDRTAWRATGNARAWLQEHRPDYEGPYMRSRLARAPAGDHGFPALVRSRGAWVLLTEAGVPHGIAGARLRSTGDGTLRVVSGARQPRRSAWRLAVVGPLATVAESSLPVLLGRPSAIGDASWVRPGRAAWSWWADSFSPRHLDAQRVYTDFAAEMGFEYNTVDAGWRAAWVPELVDYGARRGVRQLLWTDWRGLDRPRERAAALDRWRAWGVAGIKVDYLLSDAGSRLATMEAIARDAAARRMVVVFHGGTVPRGLQRTYPNVLTVEAVKGAEHTKGGQPLDPAQNVNAALIRNAVGSMDFTPVTFSAPRRTSAGHELAEAVVFESGLQHYADSPASYRARPAATALLRQVPAAWDDTVLLRGAPDRHVAVARRSGDAWFVGSLGAGPATTRRLALDFLEPGVRYRAEVTADDGAGGLAVTTRDVTATDTLTVPVAADGGFAAVLRGAAAAR